MRNMTLSALIISLLCTVQSATAAIGCMSNSWHLQKKNDAKEYHLVKCNCDCARHAHLANRNQCTVCKHYHDARPFIFIEPSKEAELTGKHVQTPGKKAIKLALND